MTSITQTETTMKTEFILFTSIFSPAISGAQAMVNKQNPPVIHNGIVTKGYILTPENLINAIWSDSDIGIL